MTDEAPSPTVWCGFHYRDALGAIRFLRDAFGFEVRAVYTSDDDPTFVEHAELVWPEGGGVMMGSVKADGVNAGIPPGVGSAYVVTDHPDDVFAKATAAGATVVREMEDADYGSRGFTVADPEGVVWSFGTYRGHHGPATVPEGL